jgi:hypothetical protein
MDRDAEFLKELWKKTVRFPWTTYKDPDIRRRFQKLSVLGYAALEREKFVTVLQNTHIPIIFAQLQLHLVMLCCDTVGTSH